LPDSTIEKADMHRKRKLMWFSNLEENGRQSRGEALNRAAQITQHVCVDELGHKVSRISGSDRYLEPFRASMAHSVIKQMRHSIDH
jgi:hypothetical protein